MSIEISGKSKVFIVVEANEQELPDSIINIKVLPTLKQAIATSTSPPATIQVIGANSELSASWRSNQQTENENSIVCPLTLNLPPTLNFDAQIVYQACCDVSKLRQRVAQQLGYSTGDGCFWLPVVNTAKGPLYGEVISIVGQASNAKLPENCSLWDLNYYQPFHLSDLFRQQLYRLGFGLIELLLASPATYLVQFGFQAQEVYFDRLWPFPAAPAIASISVQQPDLFACHWYCLSHLPISDLLIIPTASN
jgi:hypothetical protein